ncbi:YceH family protein [Candidatus Latescibacterota bacterium]
MEPLLNKTEERVLGVLVEKKITTPEYYPLSLNSLTTACNQKSNRSPVVEFDEKTVVRALDSLRDKELARVQSGADMRVPRYYHRFDEVLSLSEKEMAVLCELMLRGPQTVGELRGRTSRMAPLVDLAEVEAVLEGLRGRESGPMVVCLPRQPGRKEPRYAHLLAGEPEAAAAAEEAAEVKPERATLEVRAEDERLAALEDQVAALVEEMAALRQQFQGFRQQFE